MAKLLKFSRVGCNPCVRLENLLNSEEVEYESYDVDNDLLETSKYGVSGVPTLILVDDDGNMLNSIVGFDASATQELIEQL